MVLTLYGIVNCDTVKKARHWLASAGVAYQFHDYKKQGIDGHWLTRWCSEVGWERLLNRAGTTFRKLTEAEKEHLDQAKAIALMMRYPSIIRRPVLDGAGGVIVGFQADDYQERFASPPV